MTKFILAIGLFTMLAIGFFVFKLGKQEPVKMAQVKIGEAVFNIEVADTFASRAQGLSGRVALGGDEGMLFIFPIAGPYGFWMKEMNFPLDIIWIHNDQVVGFAENVPPPSEGAQLQTYFPPESVDKVLEINAGLVSKNGIKVGDAVVVSLE